jgi:EmrB/QacA subfamily drug resistance transporter
MAILNMQMVRVALPSMRSQFAVQADTVAWIVTLYTLSHLILMPIYGRLGDEIGKRRTFLVAIIVFFVGTGVNLLANDLPLLLIGRVIQGVGAGGIVPLSIAVISDVFPSSEQGAALGTWNSILPLAGVVGTLMAGILIDTLGWDVVFVPVLLLGLLALLALSKLVPSDSGNAKLSALFSLDWMGAVLLGAFLTALLFYVSSESLTGIPSLQDWRLLVTCLLLFLVFIVWEQHKTSPFVRLGVFSQGTFARASLCAAIRMFTMSGVMFLMPLYLAEVRELGAAPSSLILIFFDASLFFGMQLGGQLVDRWASHWPLVFGMVLQVGTMAYFGFLGETAVISLVAIGLTGHGLGAGITQPALHYAAMEATSRNSSGTAAGLYSMIRFCGGLFGTALVGVVLQRALDLGLRPLGAYQTGFLFIAITGSIGPLIGLTLRKQQIHSVAN